MKERAGGHAANLPAIDLYKTVDLATWQLEYPSLGQPLPQQPLPSREHRWAGCSQDGERRLVDAASVLGE